MKVRNQPKLRRVTRSPQVGGKNSNIENIRVKVNDIMVHVGTVLENIRVKVNDIMVHVGTVLENMKKGTSYNNKTYFEFKLAIYNLLLEI